MKFLVKSVRVWSFRWKELYPWWPFEVVTHQESIVLCLYVVVDLSPIEGRELSELLAPTKSPNAYILEFGRDDYFSERYAVEEHFFANLRQSRR